MFTNIPWSSYLLFIALLLAAWYLFVGVRYYSAELQALASGRLNISSLFRRKGSFREQPAATIEQTEDNQSAADMTPAPDMEALSSKLIKAIATAAAKDFPKEEFIFLLQIILKRFPQLNDSPYKAEVHSLIAAECDRRNYIRLSDRDLELLWLA